MSTQHVTLDLDDEEIVLDIDGVQTTYYCDFTVEATLSYMPAQVSGPPESCYPEESEIDIALLRLNEVRDEEGTVIPFTTPLRDRIADTLNIDRVHELLWEEWQSDSELAADAADHDYE